MPNRSYSALLQYESLHSPELYQYPSYMLFFGLGASFFDWQRRRHLEDLCANEDRLEAEVNQIRLNFLPIGAENHSETKKEVMHALVDEHIY